MDEVKTFKVVFHIDSLDKWGRLMANINNIFKVIQPEDADIVVVANADGIKGYGMDEHRESLKALHEQSVKLCICEQSMRGFNITRDDVPDYVISVPVAVVELAKRQHDGFAYIKP